MEKLLQNCMEGGFWGGRGEKGRSQGGRGSDRQPYLRDENKYTFISGI